MLMVSIGVLKAGSLLILNKYEEYYFAALQRAVFTRLSHLVFAVMSPCESVL